MTGVDSGNHATILGLQEALSRHKKTPERFLVPGPFRSAGAFIEIAVDLMPTSVFPSYAWLFLLAAILFGKSRAESKNLEQGRLIVGLALEIRQSAIRGNAQSVTVGRLTNQFDGGLHRFEHIPSIAIKGSSRVSAADTSGSSAWPAECGSGRFRR
jgi:hypothetical protein